MSYVKPVIAAVLEVLYCYWPIAVGAALVLSGWLWFLRRMKATGRFSRKQQDAIRMSGVVFFLGAAVALVWVAASRIFGLGGSTSTVLMLAAGALGVILAMALLLAAMVFGMGKKHPRE